MRMINPPLILPELKIFSFIFSCVVVSRWCLVLSPYRTIEVRISMRYLTQRYINASCPFAISETSCPSHCCCSCIQPFLIMFLCATFKSYKMLHVLIAERSYNWRNR
jgi:hypothetical protein